MQHHSFLMAIIFLIASCSDSSSTPPNNDEILTGIFVDSTVQGLDYITDSGLSGVTNFEGEFQYRIGDQIEFFAGPLSVGEYEAGNWITPLYQEMRTELDWERIKNTYVLLQSLDQDNDPDNGIDLRLAVANDTLGELANIDLEIPSNEFASDPQLLSILNRLTSKTAFVPLGDAMTHANTQQTVPPQNTTRVYVSFILDSLSEVLQTNGNTVVALGTEIGQVQQGYSNNYNATVVEINGVATALLEGSAGLIASQLSNIAGVQASATTTVAFAFSGGVSPGGIGNGELTINNLEINGNDITEVAENINLQPGLSAVVTGTSITVTSADGSDVLFDVNGGGNGLELIVGADRAAVTVAQALNTAGNGALTNFGALNAQEIIQGSAEEQAVIGGDIVVTLDETVTTFTAQSGNIFQTTPLLTPFTANAFDPTDPDTYNHTTSSHVFDTLGTRHQLQMYFVKQSAASAGTNVWSMYVTVDGQDVGDPVGGALTASQAEYTLRFNEGGSLDTINSDDILISNWTPLDSEGNANGAEGPLLSVNGGAIPIPFPATSSNFHIQIDAMQVENDFLLNEYYQNGLGTGGRVNNALP